MPVHQKGRAREVRESPAGSVAEFSRRSVLQRVSPSLPGCMSPTRSSLTPGCDILQRQLRGPCKRRVVRLAPGEKSSEIRKKVGQGAAWLPGVWKLKWGRIRIPCGVKFGANTTAAARW